MAAIHPERSFPRSGSRRRPFRDPERGLQLDLLGKCERVVDLDPEVSDRALDLAMPEQKLARSQVARPLIDQRDLCPSKAMRAVGTRLKPDSADPLVHQTPILAGSDVIAGAAPAREKPVIKMAPAALKPGHKRLPGGLGDLERDRPSRLLLDDGGAVTKRPARRDVADLQLYEVAPAKLGVDCAVEQREIAHAARGFQVMADRPNMLRL